MSPAPEEWFGSSGKDEGGYSGPKIKSASELKMPDVDASKSASSEPSKTSPNLDVKASTRPHWKIETNLPKLKDLVNDIGSGMGSNFKPITLTELARTMIKEGIASATDQDAPMSIDASKATGDTDWGANRPTKTEPS